MRTIFISANDTGSGKTYVTAALACHLLRQGQRVQMVKVVETGVCASTPAEQTDAGFVSAFAARHAGNHTGALSTTTLQHFSKPIAPVDAAAQDGHKLCFDALVAALNALPRDAHWRLVEGAGGLAVPLEKTTNTPRDWADFAHAINADATVLVLADRLGAINQARLLASYAAVRSLPKPGLWLNQTQPGSSADVCRSNAQALQTGAAGVPLWAIHNYGALWPQTFNAPWLK